MSYSDIALWDESNIVARPVGNGHHKQGFFIFFLPFDANGREADEGTESGTR